jgi:prepilin signal peptidase PulO-like enzyme (type II secretory pathway)
VSNELLGLLAALVGVVIGLGTHRLNQVLARDEEDATEPPLPGEPYWAPVLSAVALGLAFYRYGLDPRALVAGVVLLVLVQVLVFDARHRLILNKVIYPAIVLALLISPINPLILGSTNALGSVDSAVLGAVAGGGLFLALVLISRGGVGLGDAKLTFFMGAVVGFLPLYNPPIVRALIFGVVFGGVIALVLLLTRTRGMRDFIPYGPFLCIGGAVAILFPVQ